MINMNEKTIKVMGIAATVVGIGTTLVSDWIGEKKLDLTIEKKVMEAVTKIKE